MRSVALSRLDRNEAAACDDVGDARRNCCHADRPCGDVPGSNRMVALRCGDDRRQRGAAIDPGFLGKLAIGTSAGLAWVARCILSFLAILILRSWIGRARIPVAGAPLASLSLSGHTALQSGSLGLIHVVNDAVHLLAGSFWLGSLFLLPACLALLQVPELYKEAGVTLQRFSTIGHAAVALVLLTGIINSILTLQQWPTKLNSPYVALPAFNKAALLEFIYSSVHLLGKH